DASPFHHGVQTLRRRYAVSVEECVSRSVSFATPRKGEAIMTSAATLTWRLSMIGIRSSLAHQEIMEILEVLHVLGNSYRLACSGGGSGFLYVRFIYNFCRALAAGGLG